MNSKQFDVPLIVWTLIVAASPFYIFPSGMPQIGDYLYAFYGCGLIAVRLSSQWSPAIRRLLPFVIYGVVINIAWYVVCSNIDFLFSAAFLTFNFVVFSAASHLTEALGPRKVIRATLLGLLAGTLFQEFTALTASHVRFAGTFHNPNQLAAFVVVTLCFVSIAFRRNAIMRWMIPMTIAGVLCGFHLLVLTLSRAGILAGISLVVMTVLADLRKMVVLSILVIIVGLTGTQFDVLGRIETRFASRRVSLARELEIRGVSRLWNYPEYLLLGAGEGADHRFREGTRTGLEIHNTAAVVLFSYGIIGAGLSIAVVRAIYCNDPGSLRYMLPLFMYSLTHNTIRQTEIWVLVAIALSLDAVSRKKGPSLEL
ncbi:MAG: hypothetical protein KDA87_12110 [Planctomycetales bacterium]|nr:hypothetical protein [Planctomycetales bacterium]